MDAENNSERYHSSARSESWRLEERRREEVKRQEKDGQTLPFIHIP